MKRRKTRHPGVYRLPDGRWQVQVTKGQGGAGGKRQRTLPATVTEADAVAARAELVREIQESSIEQRPSTTLASFARTWMRQRTLKKSTTERYVMTLAHHILPDLGHLPVEEIRRADLQGWVERSSQRTRRDGMRYSRQTVHGWWRVLKEVMRDAAADFELRDPTQRIRLPKHEQESSPRRESSSLSARQLHRLLEVVAEHHPDWYAEVYVMAFTGMRAGELYALRWTDVDWEGRCIHVRHSVWRGNESGTKTGRSRVVALTDALRKVLREHQVRSAAVGETLVFPASHGEHRGAPALRTTLMRAAKKAGIPVKVGPQVLRFTANTLLRAHGVPDEVVRANLGHQTRAMGHHYYRGHVEHQVEAIDSLHALVEGQGSASSTRLTSGVDVGAEERVPGADLKNPTH